MTHPPVILSDSNARHFEPQGEKSNMISEKSTQQGLESTQAQSLKNIENLNNETLQQAIKNNENIYFKNADDKGGVIQSKELLKEVEKQEQKEILNKILSGFQKGDGMYIVGKENLQGKILQQAVEADKKVAVERLEPQIAESLGFKRIDKVNRTISPSDVKHTLKRHGIDSPLVKNGTQKAVDYDAIAKYVDYADNADLQQIIKDEKGLDKIISGKQINGYYVVIEEVRKGSNELAFKNLYFEKGDLFKSNAFNANTANNAVRPRHTQLFSSGENLDNELNLKKTNVDILPQDSKNAKENLSIIKREDGDILVRDENGEWIIRSNAPKSENGLNNKIKQGGKELYNKNQANGQINANATYDNTADSSIKLDSDILPQNPKKVKSMDRILEELQEAKELLSQKEAKYLQQEKEIMPQIEAINDQMDEIKTIIDKNFKKYHNAKEAKQKWIKEFKEALEPHKNKLGWRYDRLISNDDYLYKYREETEKYPLLTKKLDELFYKNNFPSYVKDFETALIFAEQDINEHGIKAMQDLIKKTHTTKEFQQVKELAKKRGNLNDTLEALKQDYHKQYKIVEDLKLDKETQAEIEAKREYIK